MIKTGSGMPVKATHRVSYALHHDIDVDSFPELDHLCRVRPCAQPTHLEPVGQPENVRRGDTGLHNAIKTQCPSGHPYNETNTYRYPDGRRTCRQCRRVAGAVHDAKRRNRQMFPGM
jgi:hypothetical protein